MLLPVKSELSYKIYPYFKLAFYYNNDNFMLATELIILSSPKIYS